MQKKLLNSWIPCRDVLSVPERERGLVVKVSIPWVGEVVLPGPGGSDLTTGMTQGDVGAPAGLHFDQQVSVFMPESDLRVATMEKRYLEM